ncbi:hypothetical protein LCGC14_2036920, partial [marine sediment metagenome]
MGTLAQVNTTLIHDLLARTTTSRCISRDSTGRMWAVYISDLSIGIRDLYAAYSDNAGATWTEELVESNNRPPIDAPPTIMVDSNDVPMIIYKREPSFGNHLILYIDRAGGSWG